MGRLAAKLKPRRVEQQGLFSVSCDGWRNLCTDQICTMVLICDNQIYNFAAWANQILRESMTRLLPPSNDQGAVWLTHLRVYEWLMAYYYNLSQLSLCPIISLNPIISQRHLVTQPRNHSLCFTTLALDQDQIAHLQLEVEFFISLPASLPAINAFGLIFWWWAALESTNKCLLFVYIYL